MNNILLIGFGPHSQRIYFPVFAKDGENYNSRISTIIDLESKSESIKEYFISKGYSSPKIVLLKKQEDESNELAFEVENILNGIVEEQKISGVIIATEPLAHFRYAKWALEKGLNILMDKPITSHMYVSTDISNAKKLEEDYRTLNLLYEKRKKELKGNLIFSVMTQRRYHPAFRYIKQMLEEVSIRTGCPVTSIQAFNSDGQWRLPQEIVEQHYHPYNQGYGKCSHSGYHTFDIVPWLIESSYSDDKKPNNVDIYSRFLRPNDFLFQLNIEDYKKIFPDFTNYHPHPQEKYNSLMEGFGELDAFINLVFKKDEQVVTLGSINLIHNGFAQRSWVTAQGRDLYKGNGRVRHETFIIEQGPFQSIVFESFQGKEVDLNQTVGLYEYGGEYHLDIHIFRNNILFSDWKNHEKVSIEDLGINIMEGKSRGHSEDARRLSVLEFLDFINGRIQTKDLVSELSSHVSGVSIMSGTYLSSALQYNSITNSVVNVSIVNEEYIEEELEEQEFN